MDIGKQFKTDLTAETSGVWFELDEGTKLLIGREGNKAYAKMLTSLWDKNKRVLEAKNDAADAKSEVIMVEVLAKTILLGWQGIEMDGAPLEYSVENAKRLLAIKDFRRVVTEFAKDVEAYRVQDEAQALGN